ncbi:uncharacterized protein AMSG_00918 [Thecamonas trahens ATCC 50062]|uniref:Major facilitator superfamily (MFS) profile domain-containing protein n=1 Tax=Thecamonas trahens ATCC 50062 TaxID=461836 RepID=A0A0L0DIR9_THETB|nr:hypothetical protein AMSG_00918 [Thecamonas trahens ATCC 50062]KNC52090.1 hypothetical protein AMSG_00918 [Thecamonas trahens ATCC 50062]|eukprot:XP_013762095.1 hypothetical protein AMSG_00918 [Thecamonas trahens ATCC 50062]
MLPVAASAGVVALLCLAFYAIGQGGHGFYTVGLVSNVGNYNPKFRGRALGAIVASFGASPAFFALLYRAVKPRVASYLVVVALVIAGAAALGFATLRVMPYGTLSPLASVSALWSESATSSDDDGLHFVFDSEASASTSAETEAEVEVEAEVEAQAQAEAYDEQQEAVAGPQITGRALVREPSFWLLFAILAICDGSMLMVVNNLNAFIEATQTATSQTVFMALFSTFNVAGRVVFGIASDAVLKRGVPRARFLVAIAGLMTFNLVVLALVGAPWLVPTMIGSGLAFGGMFNTIPTLVGELFGLDHYGANWGTVVLAPALGAISFGTLFGALFDASAGDGGVCRGTHCFAPALYIAAAACSVAAGLGWILDRRTGGESPARGYGTLGDRA